MEATALTLIQVFLAVVEAALPQIGVAANSVVLVDNILNGLIKILPLITDEASALWQSVSNIIAAIKADPSTTAQQMATAVALEAQYNAQFEAIAVQEDPDAPTPAAA